MDKITLKNLKEEQQRIKPGECQKYIRLVIDDRLATFKDFGLQILNGLKKIENIKFVMRRLEQPNIMFWERYQNVISTNIDYNKADDWKREDHIVQLLTQDELLQLFQSKSLDIVYTKLSQLYPGCQFLIFYLKSKNVRKNSEVEKTLLDLHFLYQLNVIQVPSYDGLQELLEELRRLTKAVAEKLYKKQLQDTVGSCRKYLLNDNKNCVRVEGSNGLSRLWQQHLNRLPLLTLNVANTIMEEYSCPKQLIDDFRNAGEETIDKISNLKVQRGCLPNGMEQTNCRRIGKVMAKKLYTLYTATDPSTLI